MTSKHQSDDDYGLTGSTLKWFSSYLTDRFQYVEINNASSKHQQLSCGVPKGSVLGPIIFTMY
ncbi:hypothetical protein LOTGIDRAFT_144586, partial [Lottia gigantea]